MRKYIAEAIKAGDTKTALEIICLDTDCYGLQGSYKDLFSCISSLMADMLHYDSKDTEDPRYYNYLDIYVNIAELNQTKVGDSNVWY